MVHIREKTFCCQDYAPVSRCLLKLVLHRGRGDGNVHSAKPGEAFVDCRAAEIAWLLALRTCVTTR